jgi:itaconate CoA-transferase
VQEVWDHPQLAARDRWREVDTPAGRIRALRPPATHSDFEPVFGAVPEVGEHGYAILAELGLSEAEIAMLRNESAV